MFSIVATPLVLFHQRSPVRAPAPHAGPGHAPAPVAWPRPIRAAAPLPLAALLSLAGMAWAGAAAPAEAQPAALVPVPELRGLTPAAAADSLRLRGLVLARVEGRHDAQIPRGRIVEQEPPAGARVPPGSPVSVLVSQVREALRVPDVVGLPLERAMAAFAGAGLRPIAVRLPVTDHTARGDVVVRQSPAAGTELPDTLSAVLPGTLYVAVWGDSVVVPDEPDSAEARQPPDGAGGPAPGDGVPAPPPATVRVPRLLDLPEREARRLLADGRFGVGEVRVTWTLARPGRVTWQRPAPGSGAAPGSAVSFGVAGLRGWLALFGTPAALALLTLGLMPGPVRHRFRKWVRPRFDLRPGAMAVTPRPQAKGLLLSAPPLTLRPGPITGAATISGDPLRRSGGQP